MIASQTLLKLSNLLVKITIIFIISFIDCKSRAQPQNNTVCALDFKTYPYTPIGECIDDEDDDIVALSHVRTTRCCRNLLNTLSQSLSLWSSQNQQFFLPRDQWQVCTSKLQTQGSVSISSCGFDDLFRGNGKCSVFNQSSFKLDYSDQFDSTSKSCSQFDVPNFHDRCSVCAQGISNMIDYVIDDLQVEGDAVEEETCSIATVIAVASSRAANETWIEEFYRCLPALDKEDNVDFKSSCSDIKLILVISVGLTAFILLILLIKYVSRTSSDKPIEGKVVSTWSGLYRFSKSEIEKAMNYGNSKVSLGSGSAGMVYQGVLPSGQLVAIKHIYKTAMSGSFTREIEGLSRIRHPNLVSLFGYCIEDDEQYLVYEYCCNGNLAHNLLRSDSVLPWDMRVRILRDCSLALRFLHTHPDGCIVHRDIKLTNILLTENMEPKLSDFGLAKMLGMEESKVFTDVRGTIGYMDPEYMTNAKITCASDIYSFGIVTLQILSGRKVIELNIDARDRLTKKAKDVVMGRRPLEDFIDPRLNGELNVKDFESILRVGVLSVASSSKGRPTIKDVYEEMDRAWRNTTNGNKADQVVSTGRDAVASPSFSTLRMAKAFDRV